jgi:hypothetical protein
MIFMSGAERPCIALVARGHRCPLARITLIRPQNEEAPALAQGERFPEPGSANA